MTEPTLYRWPENAAFGRRVPKAKFYDHGTVRPALRERFVADILHVHWAYKLAESTVHLPGTTAIPEIQVFRIETKGDDISDDLLTAIDRSVHFPIIYEILSGERVRTVAAQKSLAGKAPRVGTYFTTDWFPSTADRRPLPTALDLPNLYEAILASLLPIQRRAGESVHDATERFDRVRRGQREIAALEKKLRNEPQLNRKIELRRQLKECAATLAQLTDPAPSNKE